MADERRVCSYYDESIFTNGFLYDFFEVINTTNGADKYLVERHLKKTAMDICSVGEGSSCRINLNPISPCRGLNVYTMDSFNKEVRQTVRYHQIRVRPPNYEGNVQIYIGEHVEGNVYTVSRNGLTPFESAVMIKYFACNVVIFIDWPLYEIVSPHFRDSRSWFLKESWSEANADIAETLYDTPPPMEIVRAEDVEL